MVSSIIKTKNSFPACKLKLKNSDICMFTFSNVSKVFLSIAAVQDFCSTVNRCLEPQETCKSLKMWTTYYRCYEGKNGYASDAEVKYKNEYHNLAIYEPEQLKNLLDRFGNGNPKSPTKKPKLFALEIPGVVNNATSNIPTVVYNAVSNIIPVVVSNIIPNVHPAVCNDVDPVSCVASDRLLGADISVENSQEDDSVSRHHEKILPPISPALLDGLNNNHSPIKIRTDLGADISENNSDINNIDKTASRPDCDTENTKSSIEDLLVKTIATGSDQLVEPDKVGLSFNSFSGGVRVAELETLKKNEIESSNRAEKKIYNKPIKRKSRSLSRSPSTDDYSNASRETSGEVQLKTNYSSSFPFGSIAHSPMNEKEQDLVGPDEDYLPAPTTAIFKMSADQGFVMKFKGQDYKEPYISMNFFNKRMWLKINIDCTRTQNLRDMLMKCNDGDVGENTKDSAKSLRFMHMMKILSKNTIPQVSKSTAYQNTIEVQNVPSSVSKLLLDNAQRKDSTDKIPFELPEFMEGNDYFDLSSKDPSCGKFFKYLNQSDLKVNCSNPVELNHQDFDKFREDELKARKRLAMMTKLAVGNEVISSALAKINQSAAKSSPFRTRDNNVNKKKPKIAESSFAHCIDDSGNLILDEALQDTLQNLERFHSGLRSFSEGFMALLMTEAAEVKLNWRNKVCGSGSCQFSQKIQESNIYTPDLFDQDTCTEWLKEVKNKNKRCLVEDTSPKNEPGGSKGDSQLPIKKRKQALPDD